MKHDYEIAVDTTGTYEMPKQTRAGRKPSAYLAVVEAALEDGAVRVVQDEMTDEAAKKFRSHLAGLAQKVGGSLRWSFDDRPGSPAEGHYVWKVVPKRSYIKPVAPESPARKAKKK